MILLLSWIYSSKNHQMWLIALNWLIILHRFQRSTCSQAKSYWMNSNVAHLVSAQQKDNKLMLHQTPFLQIQNAVA